MKSVGLAIQHWKNKYFGSWITYLLVYQLVNGIDMAESIVFASRNFINNATCTHDFESTHYTLLMRRMGRSHSATYTNKYDWYAYIHRDGQTLTLSHTHSLSPSLIKPSTSSPRKKEPQVFTHEFCQIELFIVFLRSFDFVFCSKKRFA